MDKFIEVFIGVIKPPWNYLVGVMAVLLVVGPRLVEFRRGWLELRLGQACLEREKLRLEVLKLRLDVRQMAQQLQLPEIVRELETVSVSPPSVFAPSPPPLKPHGVLSSFVAGHPRLGRFIMLIAQIILGYFAIVFAAAAVVLPFVGWTDPEIGAVAAISLAIVYAALAWLAYKGLMVTRSIRNELVTR